MDPVAYADEQSQQALWQSVTPSIVEPGLHVEDLQPYPVVALGGQTLHSPG